MKKLTFLFKDLIFKNMICFFLFHIKIPIETLVAKRSANYLKRVKNSFSNESNTSIQKIVNPKNARFVCSSIDKRGKDGETLLHLCFTNVTRLHTELAKRLLQIFPKMIYDIKIGDDYYGKFCFFFWPVCSRCAFILLAFFF
jgi:hypothetical protein